MMTRRQVLPWLTSAAMPAVMPLSGCGTAPTVPAAPRAPTPEVVKAMAPTGKLRASINLGNPILANRNKLTNEVSGVSIDLAHALAARLGVMAELIVSDTALRSVELVKAGQADIGFFAIDPLRSDGIAFSAAYVHIEGAYVVRKESRFTDNAQVDSVGTRIMAGKGSAYDLYLSRTLKAATLMHARTSPSVVDSFLADGADVAAGVKQQLQADVLRLQNQHLLRLLPGRFMVIEQAMGVQAGRGAGAEAFLRSFVENAKASGFVAQALARHGIQGALVAPAA